MQKSPRRPNQECGNLQQHRCDNLKFRNTTTPEGWQQVKYAYTGRKVRTQRMNLEIYALRDTWGAIAYFFSNIKHAVMRTAARLFDTKYVLHFPVPLPFDTVCLRKKRTNKQIYARYTRRNACRAFTSSAPTSMK